MRADRFPRCLGVALSVALALLPLRAVHGQTVRDSITNLIPYGSMLGPNMPDCALDSVAVAIRSPGRTMDQAFAANTAPLAANAAAQVAAAHARCRSETGLNTIFVYEVLEGVPVRRYTAARSAQWQVSAPSDIRPDRMASSWKRAAVAPTPREGALPRGFTDAKLVHEDQTRRVYSTDYGRNGERLFLMMHRGLSAMDPLVLFDISAAPRVPMVEISKLNARMIDSVLPASTSGRGRQFYVAHYLETLSLPFGIQAGPTVLETPILVTRYFDKGAGLVAWHSHGPMAPPVEPDEPQEVINRRGARWLMLARRSFPRSLVNSYIDAFDRASRNANAVVPIATTDLGGFEKTSGTALVAEITTRENRKKTEFLAEQARRREAAMSKGHVYKAPSFWLAAPNAELVPFFEGRSYTEGLNAPIVTVVLDRYVRARSRWCARTFTATDVTFHQTKTTMVYDGYYNVKSSSTDTVDTFRVERRFAPLFGAVHRSPNLGDMKPLVDEVIGRVLQIVLNPTSVMDELTSRLTQVLQVDASLNWMFSSQGCSSPVVNQFAENLFRIATKMPTVQEGGAAIAGGLAVSDPLPILGTPRTLSEACMEISGEFLSPYDEQQSGRFCRCLERELKPLVPVSALSSFIGEYQMRVMRLNPGTLARESPEYRYAMALGRCREPQ